MVWKEIMALWYADLFRITGEATSKKLFKVYRRNPGFKYMVLFRLASSLHNAARWTKPLYYVARYRLHRVGFKFGIEIPVGTKIGEGFYIGHFGGIVIHPDAVIGKNVNISQGVTIGQSSRGKRMGVPRIGDRVYIAPGAKVIGAITVNNDAAIGANAVVTKDVPEHSVVVGIPADVKSSDGSDGYILNPVI